MICRLIQHFRQGAVRDPPRIGKPGGAKAEAHFEPVKSNWYRRNLCDFSCPHRT